MPSYTDTLLFVARKVYIARFQTILFERTCTKDPPTATVRAYKLGGSLKYSYLNNLNSTLRYVACFSSLLTSNLRYTGFITSVLLSKLYFFPMYVFLNKPVVCQKVNSVSNKNIYAVGYIDFFYKYLIDMQIYIYIYITNIIIAM
jgi:hypothetical protein